MPEPPSPELGVPPEKQPKLGPLPEPPPELGVPPEKQPKLGPLPEPPPEREPGLGAPPQNQPDARAAGGGRRGRSVLGKWWLHAKQREHMEHAGFTVWFTGLPGSGKTTLGRMLVEELRRRGMKAELLDADELRQNLCKGLGYSKEDRDTNIRRIGLVAHLLTRNGVAVVVAAIAPYRAVRDENRALIGNYVEVHVDCPLEVLKARDPKGLYEKALRGEIRHFTGIDDPYERPEHPEVRLRTDIETKEESVRQVLGFLEARGYVPPAGPTQVRT